jgi:hypothetical protein
MLQVATQLAVIPVAPAATAVTRAEALTIATAGCELDQFSGTVTDKPWLSTTSAANVLVFPAAAREKEVSVALATWILMLCTGQVTQAVGVLNTAETVAKAEVWPGVLAVTTPLLSTVATSVDELVQVNGPTDEVMSTPLLNACAVSCWVWPEDLQSTVAGEMVTRSTCKWVNTGTVVVSEPAVTLMLAVPGCECEASQTMKFASQVPAHTKPVVETVTTAVLLEAKLIVGGLLTALPLESTTVADSVLTSPKFSERLVGFTLMALGAVLELLPPQAASAMVNRNRIVVRRIVFVRVIQDSGEHSLCGV